MSATAATAAAGGGGIIVVRCATGGSMIDTGVTNTGGGVLSCQIRCGCIRVRVSVSVRVSVRVSSGRIGRRPSSFTSFVGRIAGG